MSNKYFCHSPYTHGQSKKEKIISEYFRNLDGCIIVGEPGQEFFREVISIVEKLNQDFPRSRNLQLCLNPLVTNNGYRLYASSGPANTVAAITIQIVTSTKEYGDS